MHKNPEKCLQMRKNLLEQINIFSSEISITIDIARSLLKTELFANKNESTEKFRESIRSFISTLLEMQVENVSHIEFLSAVLDGSLEKQAKKKELEKIRKLINNSKKKLYLLSKKLTDNFQKIRFRQ